MNTLYFFACTISSWTLQIVALILSPLLSALSVYQHADHLPRRLYWFDTLDNTLDGDVGLYPNFPASGWGWRRWWRRVMWLCRNCAYGFSQTVIAAQLYTDHVVKTYGDAKIENKPDGKSGWLVCVVRGADGKVRTWCVMLIYQWGTSGRCLRSYLGWKIKEDAQAGRVKEHARRMHVFNLNPFASFVQK